VDEEKKHEVDSKKKKADWWTDSMYMGKTYLPLSDNPDKVVTLKGLKDEKQIPSGTWTTSYHPHNDSHSTESFPPATRRGSDFPPATRRGGDFKSKNESPDRNFLSPSQSYPYPYPSPYSDSRNSNINAHSYSDKLGMFIKYLC
jgi:hypothetical protein